jgi:hypothetical protein
MLVFERNVLHFGHLCVTSLKAGIHKATGEHKWNGVNTNNKAITRMFPTPTDEDVMV